MNNLTALIGLVFVAGAGPATAQNLVITNARILDGTGKVIERGAVVHAAESATLLNDRAALETHLGVTDTGPHRFGRMKY